MQRLAAGWETREGGRNGRSFPLQRDGESLKGGRNLFATRSNDRSARWNSEYLCRFFSFFFFFLGSREFVWKKDLPLSKNCDLIIKIIYFIVFTKIRCFGIDSKGIDLGRVIFIEREINSFTVKFIGKLFKYIYYIIRLLRRFVLIVQNNSFGRKINFSGCKVYERLRYDY